MRLWKRKPTEKGFIKWLESQSPGAIVGWAQDAQRCPVSSYVRGLGYERPQTLSGGITVNGMFGRRIFYGAWIDRAVNTADVMPGPIRARDMLAGIRW